MKQPRYEHIDTRSPAERDFHEGDRVRTCKGARYCGVVSVIFMTRAGALRAVVEAVHEDFEETLHVYPLSQLVKDTRQI